MSRELLHPSPPPRGRGRGEGAITTRVTFANRPGYRVGTWRHAPATISVPGGHVMVAPGSTPGAGAAA